MFKRIESGIAGRGLGFNYLGKVKSLASRLPIKGAAFVKADGSIKVIAEGEEKFLALFAEELENGATENFYVKWSDSVDNGNFYVIAS